MKQDSFHILINKQAGHALSLGLHTMEALIKKHLPHAKKIEFTDGPALAQSAAQSNMPLLIGGGDGSVKSCAQALLNGRNQGFGILPLGTMNLLAKDLGIPHTFEAALKAYAAGSLPRDIDVGHVNKDIFLCCAGLGTIPETSQYREDHREDIPPVLIPRLTAYFLRKIDRTNRQKITMRIDGKTQTIRTSALVISNNQYTPEEEWSDNNFKRTSLQDGILGIYSAVPVSGWDKIRLVLRLSMGRWDKDPVIKKWQGKTVTLKPQQKKVTLSLDGENHTFNTPLYFSVRQQALKVLLPVG